MDYIFSHSTSVTELASLLACF